LTLGPEDCFKGGSTDLLFNACLMNTFGIDLESI